MISNENSIIFFSQSVTHQVGKIISGILGFSLACELGKYLGVPLLDKKVTKATYYQLVD